MPIEVDSRRQVESVLKIKTFPYDEMQSVPAWETQYFQMCYQK